MQRVTCCLCTDLSLSVRTGRFKHWFPVPAYYGRSMWHWHNGRSASLPMWANPDTKNPSLNQVRRLKNTTPAAEPWLYMFVCGRTDNLSQFEVQSSVLTLQNNFTTRCSSPLEVHVQSSLLMWLKAPEQALKGPYGGLLLNCSFKELNLNHSF